MNKVILLAVLFLFGCGGTSSSTDSPKKSGNRQFNSSNQIFDLYKNNFFNDALYFHIFLDLTDIPINFGDLSEFESASSRGNFIKYSWNETVGVCVEYSSGLKEILIKESSWNQFLDIQREILIYHELGHCALNLNHNDKTYKGYDLSLMNSFLINPNNYLNFYEEYLAELFLGDDSYLKNKIDNF